MFFEWFYFHPALRYGGYNLVALIIFIPASLFLEKYSENKSNFKKKVYIILILVISVFLLRNTERIYKELDERLSQSRFLAGKDYTIADIATFPWIARHEWHDIGLKKFNNLTRWYKEISKRKAVQKGYDLLNKGDRVPKV